MVASEQVNPMRFRVDARLSQQEIKVYLDLLIKALRGARSTLRSSYPEYVIGISEVIELPRKTLDQIQALLIKSHHVIVDGRNDVYEKDQEASNLFDAIHNIPYGLLGRFEGGWDWRESLPAILREHEKNYLNGLKKYTGMLAAL